MEETGVGAARTERVRAAQRGDAEAFACLVADYERALGRFCDRLVGPGAAGEDLAQETLLRAFQALPRLEDAGRFGAWLFGIATNLARVTWRRRHRAPLSLEGVADSAVKSGHAARPAGAAWLSPSPVTPDLVYERAEQARRLLDAIESLPPRLRHTLILHYVEDRSYAEVAAAMRVPVTTVKGWLHKSRARLRRPFADEIVVTRRSAAPRPEPAGADAPGPAEAHAIDPQERKETLSMTGTGGTEDTGGNADRGGAPTAGWWEDLPTISPSLFGDGALAAFRAAEEEARRWQHGYVGTEHLLLAVLAAPEGLPAKVLATLGAPVDAVRAALERRLGRGDEPAPARLGVAPRARIALELAREDMRFLKHERIGPEHVLLGLVQVPQGD